MPDDANSRAAKAMANHPEKARLEVSTLFMRFLHLLTLGFLKGHPRHRREAVLRRQQNWTPDFCLRQTKTFQMFPQKDMQRSALFA
jgi:hypothetical protein